MNLDYVFMFVSAIVIIICFYLVISPFFSKELSTDNVMSPTGERTIEAIYSAVNELEMDYLMKKISEEDFHNLKGKYEEMAAKFLNKEKEIVKNGKRKNVVVDDIDNELLKELEELRRSRESGK